MSDPRLLVAVGAIVFALLVAVWAHRGERRRAVRSRLDLEGIDGRIVFFSDVTRTRCDIVRAHLEALEVEFTEVAYDREPEVHRRVGVTGVPLVVIRDADGAEIRRFAGVMPQARLAIALGRDRR
jgi:hypothetical protein